MKLIINADDFGLTIGVSRGILDGMKKGILTDTSAIVNTGAFMESAQMAIKQGVTSMGIHLLLSMGEPLSQKTKVQSLLTKDGCFASRKDLAKMKFNMDEVRMELEAQIMMFLSSGLHLNHMDTHHGFMNHSKEMANVFVELSKKYQVPLRNETSMLPIEKNCFLNDAHVFKTQLVYFNHGTPHHTLEDLKTFIKQANHQYDCIEIGCHPGYSDDELRHLSVLNDDREIELAIFMRKELKDCIEMLQIELCNYSTI